MSERKQREDRVRPGSGSRSRRKALEQGNTRTDQATSWLWQAEQLTYENNDDMSTLERAIAIAAEAHAGQLDWAGVPYVLHPLRMMLRMPSLDERIVAVLHDVCEDCPEWTFDRLRQEGFPERVIVALDSLTKRNGEGYEAFVRRAAANPIGRSVKLADLNDNSDLSRIGRALSERERQLMEKYRRAIDLIGQTSSEASTKKIEKEHNACRDGNHQN